VSGATDYFQVLDKYFQGFSRMPLNRFRGFQGFQVFFSGFSSFFQGFQVFQGFSSIFQVFFRIPENP
jgi:hypothetical protein